MGYAFTSLQWIAGWVAIGTMAAAIASLLYLACDLVEDYTSLTRRILKRAIQGVCILYLILAFDPDIPVKNCIIGAACHASYLPLMWTFPVLENPLSFFPILALIATIVNHFSWFRHFISAAGTPGGVTSPSGMFGFFLIFVWMVPLGFFVSMITADECLPMGRPPSSQYSSPTASGSGGALGSGERGKRTGVFKRLMDILLFKKDDVISKVAPGLTKQY